MIHWLAELTEGYIANSKRKRSIYLANLFHEVHNEWAGPNTSGPDSHSVRNCNIASSWILHGNCILRNLHNFISSFYINAIPSKLVLSKVGNSLVEPFSVKKQLLFC